MSIEDYFGDWIKVIDKELLLSTIKQLDKKDITPDPKNWFKTFELCSYNDLKVIFIAQDPYPQKDIATGIALANKKGTITLSSSLNIIKESCINFEIPKNSVNFDPTLESWCKQGILMLNASLTTKIGHPGLHINIWRPFIKKLISNLNKHKTGIIYVLLGDTAKTFKPFINKKFNYILEEKHPSYYARINSKMPSTIFNEIKRIVKVNNNINVKFYEDVLV